MTNVYLNGHYLPLDEAKVSVLDRGFMFGDGVYEVIPAYGGHLLRGSEHLDRLDRSLAGIRVRNPLSLAQWVEIFTRLLSSVSGDQSIYLQVTRGVAASRQQRFPARAKPTVLVMTKALPLRDPAIGERGVSAVTREDFRWGRCDIKSVALLASVLLGQEATDSGAEETLLVRDGIVQEGSFSNVFIVSKGVVITPPKSRRILTGITRGLVMDLARANGLAVCEQDVSKAALHDAEEVWITSSTREVQPVTRIDDKPIGHGLPGPIYRRIDAAYQSHKHRVCGGLS